MYCDENLKCHFHVTQPCKVHYATICDRKYSVGQHVLSFPLKLQLIEKVKDAHRLEELIDSYAENPMYDNIFLNLVSLFQTLFQRSLKTVVNVSEMSINISFQQSYKLLLSLLQ